MDWSLLKLHFWMTCDNDLLMPSAAFGVDLITSLCQSSAQNAHVPCAHGIFRVNQTYVIYQ